MRAAPLDVNGFELLLLDLGKWDYDSAYLLQRELVDEKKRNLEAPDRLILVEHPDVYTYGRRSREDEVNSIAGADVRFIERGGQVTYHNPGQLVAYPILFLREKERDIHLHLRRLEDTIIDVLADFGLEGMRRKNATGVWMGENERKIASIGVAATSWITYHGVALNVCNDLSGFAKIQPCGFPSSVMTSIERELGAKVDMNDAKKSFAKHFCRRFDRTIG
jgi:lipoate-protein ligase B